MFLGQLLDYVPEDQWLNIVKNDIVLFKGPKQWIKNTMLKNGKLGSSLLACDVLWISVSLDKKKETKIMKIEIEGVLK